MTLCRSTKNGPWELIALTDKKSVAFKSIAATIEQEHKILNHKSFQAIVVAYDNWIKKRVIEIKPELEG
jgi:hypothetical protein